MKSSSHSSLFPFSTDQVRIVLYRECDWTGRRLLFDSSAIQKVELSTATEKETASSKNDNGNKAPKNFIEVSNGFGYKYVRPGSDCNSIGEMIFGSVAMSFRGTSLKVSDTEMWVSSPGGLSPVHALIAGALASRPSQSVVLASIPVAGSIKLSLAIINGQQPQHKQ